MSRAKWERAEKELEKMALNLGRGSVIVKVSWSGHFWKTEKPKE